VVTRTFTVTDLCDNTAQAQQTINIDDQTDPTIAAPATAQYRRLRYSRHNRTCLQRDRRNNNLAQLTTAGGTADDNCGIQSITYVDSQTGTCPIVVTRTFTVTDLCDNTAQAQQTINIDDQTDPTIAAPATANIAGCGTADITGLAYSETAEQ